MKRALSVGIAVLVMGFLGVAHVSAADGDMVKLEVKLPKPLFIGTPKNIRSPNLEKARKKGTKRPDFMVPKGTVLLSAEKEVTSSDMAPIIGELELITDADKEGYDGSYVELGPGRQYVQIDLEKKCKIYALAVWHYHSQARVYRDCVIQTADDPDFIMNVKTIYNNDHDNSSGLGIGKDKEYIETNEGRLIDGKGTEAQYVRLYSNGSTSGESNHYIEVEVYGKPLE